MHLKSREATTLFWSLFFPLDLLFFSYHISEFHDSIIFGVRRSLSSWKTFFLFCAVLEALSCE